jgi:hypothetical protein
MSAVQMKENVKIRYGEDSNEFGYFMHVFSRRPLDWTISVYNKLMEK